MFYALAKDENYWADKINVFITFAPVCMPNKYFPLFNFGFRVEKNLARFVKFFKIWDLFGRRW